MIKFHIKKIFLMPIAFIVTLMLAFVVILVLPLSPVLANNATGVTIYGNATDDRCFYERVVTLSNGDLLATWMREFPIDTGWSGMKSFYFYKSSDHGKTWSYVSELDPSNYQGLSRNKMGMPGMFVLPQDIGDLSEGTVLFATSDWDVNSDYCIHIWVSTNNGSTWSLFSNLAPRGDSSQSVWEPEFAISNNELLVCYYSDERQDGYDQCIALETSEDGVNWSDYTIIVGEHDPDWERGVDPPMWRPGMPRVIQLVDGTYFMAYENVCGGYDGIVSCRTSEDGIDWSDTDELGTTVGASGTAAYQCPEIACIDDGSDYGRIFLRGMNDTCSGSLCYTSTNAGQTWQLIDAPLTAVRRESVASGWSGAFVAHGDRLIELNNCYNGSYNEVRCGTGIMHGSKLIVDGADYKIKNVVSDYCLDDADGSKEWGNQMIQWTDNNLHTQSWHTKNISSAASEYFALICNWSDLALDNPNGSQESGTRIIQWDKNYSSAQQWKFNPISNGYFKIQNRCSGLYLNTENDSTELHAYIVQSTPSSSNTQKWKVERIYEVARLRSYNIYDCHVYHNSSGSVLIANESTSMSPYSSQWRVVPGLKNSSYISFESLDHPGYYLRHYDGNVIISPYEDNDIFKQDATWRPHDGLYGSGGKSFETYNFDDIYMRHYNSFLIISEINSDLDKKDATFYMECQ